MLRRSSLAGYCALAATFIACSQAIESTGAQGADHADASGAVGPSTAPETNADGASDAGNPIHDAAHGDAKAQADAAHATDASHGHDGSSVADASVVNEAGSPAEAGAPLCAGCEIVTTTPTGIARPTDIVVDATNLYFSFVLGRTIYKAPKSGGGTPVVVAQEPDNDVAFLAGDATHLYTVMTSGTGYRVDRVAKTGGAITLLYEEPSAGSIDVDDVVVDGSNTVYLAAGKQGGGSVRLFAIDKTTAQSTPLNDNWYSGTWLVGSGSDLYWWRSDRVYQAPKSGQGTPVERVWAGSNASRFFAVDGTEIFYTDRLDVEIHSVTTATTQDVTLNPNAPSADWTIGPMVDTNYVYAIGLDDSNNSGTIYRVPRAGGVTEVFADHQPSPRALVHDATYIYWAVGAGPNDPPGISGHILRKAK